MDETPSPAPLEGASAVVEPAAVEVEYDHRVRADPEEGFPVGYLSEMQADVYQVGNKQFNFISGGRQAGLSLIAFYTVTRGAFGCSYGGRTAFFSDHPESFAAHRLRLERDVEPLFPGGRPPNGDRMVLDNAMKENGKGPGLLIVGTLEDGQFDLLERVDQIVIDNAHEIPGFRAMWEDHILPLALKWNARVYVFGRAKGVINGFGQLCLLYADHPNGRHVAVPSWANPELPRKSIVAKRKVMGDLVWRQEHAGEIVEGVELTDRQQIIAADETFVQWCDRLALDGLEVDGHPFRLDNRPAMRWIYEQVPSTVEEAFGKRLVLMKCSQVGFTVMEMLAMLYMALKFMPSKIGMFLPSQNLATVKSSQRFIPIVRTVPDAHRLMIENPSGTKGGEGNVLTRNMGKSVFYFLWTTGKATTESLPMDVLSFDEVQEMAIADMEKTQERLSASSIRYTMMGSTANWPDRDIHFFYKKGTRHRFWTHCSGCGTDQLLDDHFPNCIRLRDHDGAADYRYVCHSCDKVIPDPQAGEWRAEEPDAGFQSIHFPQLLSPTISPREIIESYHNADDMKNFYNRKLGKPYTDPSQVPVTLEILNECARIGQEMGVVWETRGSGYFMGLDQGGLFNVAIVAKRLPSGHMAVVHVEEIYADDPFERCSDLMKLFNVAVCVVESLPNYNDAKRFAGRHIGKVFLASYTQMKDEMMRWGDAVPTQKERKTVEEDRDRYTVTLDQYKCMQVATSRITAKVTVFPDPMGLIQKLKIKERSVIEVEAPILKDRVFLHLTRVALVAEMDEEERKFKRRVVKVGIDPHFAYAFMLLNVAWARSHGTTMFLNPQSVEAIAQDPAAVAVADAMPGLPQGVIDMIRTPDGTCGRCIAFEEGRCNERNFLVAATAPGCDLYLERGGD